VQALRVSTIGLATCVLLAACSDTVPDAGPLAPSLSAASSESAPSLNLYGVGGLVRAYPSHPCADALHRQFDFWVGKWDVYNPAGTLVGANTLVPEGKEIPPGVLVVGTPAKVVRDLKAEEQEGLLRIAQGYVERSRRFKLELREQPLPPSAR